jgi:hypothetical protein
MTDRIRTGGKTARLRTIRQLHELIAALDRRLPQVEREGEASIVRAAAALRAAALKRIEELEAEGARASRPLEVG